MNLTSQEYLARLLAKENLVIQHGNYSTASFDTENRILRLPLWEDKGKAVYDLLVGHEVGHALYTPNEGLHDALNNSDIPKSYLNIVEDIRIERMIQETYPGIVKAFRNGYKRLFEDNLFGTEDREPTSLMDRLNIHSKGRGLYPIEFDDEESPLVKEAMTVKTWKDVVEVCKKLKEFLDAKQEEQDEEALGVGDMGESEVESEKQEGGESPSKEKEEGEGDDSDADDNNDGDEGDNDDDGEEGAEAEGDIENGEEGAEAPIDKLTDTFTEDTYREKEKELLDMKENRYGRNTQARYSSGISKENLKKMVIPYKEVLKERNELQFEEESDRCYMVSEDVQNEWLQVKKHLESTANLLAKDFERKKAAYEYSRATVAKKGSLNPNKLHQYKYSEDIFLSVTRLAQAKSHGIVGFVDMSGSMCDIIEDVISQTLTIAMFCKKVNIPFKFYTFTSRWTATDRMNGSDDEDLREVGPTEIENVGAVKIAEVLSSEMKSAEFKIAMKGLFGCGIYNGYRYGYSHDRDYYIDRSIYSPYDEMGTTPLIQTTLVAADIVEKFQRKYNVQKTNIMILTDGYADSLGINTDGDLDVDTYKTALNFRGKMVKGESSRELYKGCLKRLREITGAKITGFFLAPKPRELFQGLWDVPWEARKKKEDKDLKKEFNKNHIVSFKDALGYNDYFIVKVGNRNIIEENEFTLPEGKTHEIKDIRNEFKKHNKSKKIVKQLVNKISEAVAV